MDRGLIERKLESLRRCPMRLRTRCPSDAETLAQDFDAQDIVALNLARAAQICVDIAAHWIVDRPDIPPPATMGQSIDALVQTGSIPSDLALKLKKAVGSPNLAIHRYDAINWDLVHAICTSRLEDFDRFAAIVARNLMDD